MNNLQIFQNKEFGEVRTATINSEPYLMLNDVCYCLGIVNSRDAKSRLKEDGVATTDTIDALGRSQQATFINESNLYRLIFQSRKPNAEKFTDWVTSEVLPSIRKTGSYQKQLSEKEIMRIQLTMIDDVSERVDKLENTMVIDYGQQQVLKKRVNGRVTYWLGGKESNAYKEISKKVFSECNNDIQDYFNVNSRNNVPKLKFDAVIDYIANWEPSTNTKMLIRDTNAQMCIS